MRAACEIWRTFGAGPSCAFGLPSRLTSRSCFFCGARNLGVSPTRCGRLPTKPARVLILGQPHALALIGQRAPGLGDFQNGLPVILRDRVSDKPLAFNGPATVLGKDVHRGSSIGRWSAIAS